MSTRHRPRPAPETRLRRAEDAWLADASDRLRQVRPSPPTRLTPAPPTSPEDHDD